MLVLGAIQADNPVNREFARVIGVDGIPWPPPYKNSIPAVCGCCGGAVWLGPEQQRARLQATAAGAPEPGILCLLCCCLTGAADQGSIVSLTGKGPGE